MRPKKIHKKLSLNKKTIANLGNEELSIVKGGYITGTCPDPCQTGRGCTAAGCISLVEPECAGTRYPCTMTKCTFYCD